MPNRSTRFTPFFMVYGAEAVLPTDLQYGSPRIQAYQLDTTKGARRDVINLLEESRDTAIIRSTVYQQALRRYHVHKVHLQAFQVGDLVVRRILTKKGKHNLAPPWEGPYLVAEVLQLGAYQLQEIDYVTFPNAWCNIPRYSFC
jgi:hypothetical protein